MNGQYLEVNEKAHDLRSKLYREHFAMTEQEAEDPLCDDTWNKIRTIANVIFYYICRLTLRHIGKYLVAVLMTM